ncbi:unnamed protein product [Camellia sinensis]
MDSLVAEVAAVANDPKAGTFEAKKKALGIPIHRLVQAADSVCLSKGLGAPVGTVIVGSKDFITRAKTLRKTLGGGMRQVGVLCATTLVAVQENVGKLESDHNNANVKLLDWGEESHRTEAEIASLRAAFTQEVVVWHKLDHPNVTKRLSAGVIARVAGVLLLAVCIYVGVYKKKKVQDKILLSARSEHQSIQAARAVGPAPALIKAEVPWSARRGTFSNKDRVLKTVKGEIIASSGSFVEEANAADLIQRRQRSEFQSSVKGTLFTAIKANPDLVPSLLTLAMNDAMTYDKATKSGGPNGSVRFSVSEDVEEQRKESSLSATDNLVNEENAQLKDDETEAPDGTMVGDDLQNHNVSNAGNDTVGKYFCYDLPVSEETGVWIPVSVPPMSGSEHEEWNRGFSFGGGYFADGDMGWNQFVGEEKEMTMWDVVLDMLLVARGKVTALASVN